MVPAHNVVAFAVASTLLIMIPGPSVLFTISRAMVLGRRAALLNVLGNAAGVTVQIVAVAAGLGSLVAQSVAAYTVVKWAGAAYIVYLGIQAIRHRSEDEGASDVAPTMTRASRVLREGFIVGITNPKTIVFLVAMLPQFVARDAGAVPAQMLVLGAVFVAIALCLDSLWALGAGAARDWFVRSPRRMHRLRGAGGSIMVGLGVSLVVGGGRPD